MLQCVNTSCALLAGVTGKSITGAMPAFYNGVSFEENPVLATIISNLKHILKNDINACDMKWSLFVTAAQSYRYDKILKPIPPKYTKTDGTCDIQKVLSTIYATPPFPILLKKLKSDNLAEGYTEAVQLVHWVLISSPFITSVKKAEFKTILSTIKSTIPLAMPSHIFKVECLPHTSVSEEKFATHAKDYATGFAFHGNKLESFYSILNLGLQQNFCKVAAFGEGIYISSEPSKSPAGTGWKSSRIGENLSCLAICEYVEYPRYLKCGFKETGENLVPNKYVLVRNNEIVRVRYLLVYPVEKRVKRSPGPHTVVFDWMARNRSLVSIVFYAFLLSAIGVANTTTGAYYQQLFGGKFIESMEDVLKRYL